MKIYPLYSSSSGNSFCLETENDNILIDCGVSYRALCNGLKSINKDISQISSILITHEHSDHIKGIPNLLKKNNIPIYATDKTLEYIKDYSEHNGTSSDSLNNMYEIDYNKTFKLNDLDITPFKISHDAVKPCGFCISEKGKTLTFSTDLGYVSQQNLEYMKMADFLVLEANYDLSMLTYGPYPYPVKQRIISDLGHLSNDDTANTIFSLVSNNNKSKFLLAHLSQNNNMIDIAKQTIDILLEKNGINLNDVDINFATKKLSSEVYQI